MHQYCSFNMREVIDWVEGWSSSLAKLATGKAWWGNFGNRMDYNSSHRSDIFSLAELYHLCRDSGAVIGFHMEHWFGKKLRCWSLSIILLWYDLAIASICFRRINKVLLAFITWPNRLNMLYISSMEERPTCKNYEFSK